MSKIIIENEKFALTLGENCHAESLMLKSNGEECLDTSISLPFFSIKQLRPYNNEIKLIYQTKETVFNADRVRLEDGKLYVGFELLKYEAIVEYKATPDYISFELVGYNLYDEHFFDYLKMDTPPVEEFRLIQLPIKKREYFGDWLNVVHDDKAAVCVLANSIHPKIDSRKEKEGVVLTADARRGIKLVGCSASLIVSEKESFLDCVDALERDYGLPRGVKSRRSEKINRSIYRSQFITPLNVDYHLKLVKQLGVECVSLYVPGIFREVQYMYAGNYDYREEYPNGAEDLKAMVKKFNDIEVTVGIHFLQSHIGMKSRYATPVADHRLALRRHFTLAKPIDKEETTIYVEETPIDCPIDTPQCRVLKFGGELISYEGYTTEYPYCFYGCTRGYNDTYKLEHELGKIGGLLDLSEFGEARSVHANQNSSLQDEVGEKLATAYNETGLEFIYFDGSEATQPPYDYNVALCQYKVYKKCKKEPLFAEGAAKTHFGWHMITGANAFDYFSNDVFKEKIIEFPAKEAKMLAADFTRCNFGWWRAVEDTQPDMYEFGTSVAAGWDCPVTISDRNVNLYEKNARIDDICEVIYRWEDVRRKNWLTPEQKEELRNTDHEHILLVNENGEYELTRYEEVKDAAGGNEEIKAFVFERGGAAYAVIWHKSSEANLTVNTNGKTFTYEKTLGDKMLVTSDKEATLEVSGRKYLHADISLDEMREVLKTAIVK